MQDLIERPVPRNGSEGPIDVPIPMGIGLQQTRTNYCTALNVQRPRSLNDVMRRFLEEARLAGEDFYYGWRAGGESIEGPSVKMAYSLARCWGNCAIDLLPVQEMSDAWIFTALFIDLETGFTLPRQYRMSKDHKVSGNMDAERKADIRFQIGQSKAIRNVILNALPALLVAKGLSAAKEGVRAELENLVKKNSLAAIQDRLVSALGKCGVKESAILARCGVAERKGLTLDHLVILRGDLTALQQGQERAETLFPAVDVPKQVAAPQEAHASQEAAPPVRKVTKKTLKEFEDWRTKLGVTPAEIETYCAQLHVNSITEASEESVRSLISEMQQAETRRMSEAMNDAPAEGRMREPGED